MNWIMTIAAGVAIGYFAVQFLMKRAKDGAADRNTEALETVKAAETGAEAGSTPRRLHRSVRNRQIAGVCGGIAEYLNTDPSVVRLVTVVLVLGWGSGLLAYLICALVLPEGE